MAGNENNDRKAQARWVAKPLFVTGNSGACHNGLNLRPVERRANIMLLSPLLPDYSREPIVEKADVSLQAKGVGGVHPVATPERCLLGPMAVGMSSPPAHAE
ncbi:hypothetical protein GCM10022409_47420 [Hymenobacter glaciei]|uniref:Uncharacterized protein n=1 Tax=Hymenobacter glaciei TaxID=877209 RepID=A0ABP7UZF7_9BACT